MKLSTFFNIFFRIKYVVKRLYIIALNNLVSFLGKKNVDIKLNILSVDDVDMIYVNKMKDKFIKSFVHTSMVDYNSNISEIFYDRVEFAKLMINRDNHLELLWKSRIMIENTPRGNIIIYYDAFREGFTYYCDQTVPYRIINAVVMKYVLIYRCRDFFTDNSGIIPDFTSIFIIMRIEQDELDANKKRDVMKKFMYEANSDLPFVKLKSSSTIQTKSELKKVSSKIEEEIHNSRKTIFNNKVIYAGKIANKVFISHGNKVPIVSSEMWNNRNDASNSTYNEELMNDGLIKNISCVRESCNDKISYKDYKLWIQSDKSVIACGIIEHVEPEYI